MYLVIAFWAYFTIIAIDGSNRQEPSNANGTKKHTPTEIFVEVYGPLIPIDQGTERIAVKMRDLLTKLLVADNVPVTIFKVINFKYKIATMTFLVSFGVLAVWMGCTAVLGNDQTQQDFSTTAPVSSSNTTQVLKPVILVVDAKGTLLPNDSRSQEIADGIRDDLSARLRADNITATIFNVINYHYEISGCCTQFFTIKIQVNNDVTGYVSARAYLYRSEPLHFYGVVQNQTLTDPIRWSYTAWV
ncbi:hypothetical protein BV898_15583 [Hypsibius exemplaris]|uniref:SEA domain-containing protein n=1 Tax=Hypsibius exemplaris TaxID=2072580 RepID=A0A9X6NE99_HYPEX|nr:hypothetical protein BV898_15583 [Hypsibius exemplaris]